ncbi:hypothetical protein F5Y16DRAFT_92587 [Xylariaceae sp. FL0255]|nr:hypothetical protein F5Y16DRAFT_92587 [Xylariaceae sp. FL0255]
MSLRSVLTTLVVLTLTALSTAQTGTSGEQGKESPSAAPQVNVPTVHGCYSNLGTLKLNQTYNFNAQSWCGPLCYNGSYPVAASFDKNCYCGNEYPNSAYIVDDSKCNQPCPGYGDDACGGLNTWTVYNTGLIISVAESPEGAGSSSSSSSSVSSSSTTPATSSAATAPMTVTATPTSTPSSSSSSSSHSSTVGIAVGAVVGVIALLSIGAGLFFFMRKRKNSEIEEEHRRNAAVNAFISGGKPPSSSGGMSMADSRMDPIMNRRLSDGSIADNQDYSRRILRVTNA